MIERQKCRLSLSSVWRLNPPFLLVQTHYFGIVRVIITQEKTTVPGSLKSASAQQPSPGLRPPAPVPTGEGRPLGRFLPYPKHKLREQLAEVCRFRHMSHRSENAYWHWIKGFILFQDKRHPREMGAAEVQAYLSHLAVKQDVAPSTQNQALRFG